VKDYTTLLELLTLLATKRKSWGTGQ